MARCLRPIRDPGGVGRRAGFTVVDVEGEDVVVVDGVDVVVVVAGEAWR